MKRTYIIKPVLPLLFVLLLSHGNVFSQYYNTIHWMQGIPQASYANPALFPRADLYIGMPFLSSVYMGFGNSSWAWNDYLRKDGSDQFYWDEDRFLSKLKEKNLLEADFQLEILAFGLRRGNNYFSFNVTEKFKGLYHYSDDFASFILKGNAHLMGTNGPADLSGLGLDLSHYREYALGYAREFSPRFQAGLRGKLLFGKSNLWVERNDLSLFTDPNTYEWLAEADMLINITGPATIAPLDDFSTSTYDYETRDYLFNSKNMGLGLDVGLVFKPTDKLSIAASALDIGFINWKENAENFELKGQFTFDGLDLRNYIGQDIRTLCDDLADSIRGAFDVVETANAYRRGLNTRVMVSAAYDLTQRHQIGLLSRGFMYEGVLHPSFTLSYQMRPTEAVSLALSYSVAHWNYANVGFGFNVNLGPVQLYAVADNIIGALQPHQVQMANIHFGMNWVFGYRSGSHTPMIRW